MKYFYYLILALFSCGNAVQKDMTLEGLTSIKPKGEIISYTPCFDTTLQLNHVQYCDYGIRSRHLIVSQQNDTVLNYLISDDMEGSNIRFEDLNTDGFTDIIIEQSDQNFCNYIFLLGKEKPICVEDCRKYNLSSKVLINGETFYSTLTLQGCAGSSYLTYLIKFESSSIKEIYKAEVNYCDDFLISLYKGDKLIKKTDARSFRDFLFKDQEFWSAILQKS